MFSSGIGASFSRGRLLCPEREFGYQVPGCGSLFLSLALCFGVEGSEFGVKWTSSVE